MPAVVAEISAEIRRIVAPPVPLEMKEQVAGLVIERLHSRLATCNPLLNSALFTLYREGDTIRLYKLFSRGIQRR